MATLHLNVEFSAVADEHGKFGRLAKLLGLADADHARGKCEHLWVACTRRGEIDLPQWLVEQVLGERGPDALVESELARWAGGRGDSKTRRLRISGARKHCTWMADKQEQTSKAGKKNANEANRSRGKFAPKPPSGDGADTTISHHPSELSSELRSLPEEELSPARAIPEPVVDAPTPAERAGVRARVRTELDAARTRAGATRKIRVTPLLAFDQGIDGDLNGQLMLAPTREALELLEKQALHAVAMAELRFANGTESFEWFTGAIFKGGNFARFAGMTPDGAKAARPAGKHADPPAPQRPDPGPTPITRTPEERAAARAMLPAEFRDDDTDESEAS